MAHVFTTTASMGEWAIAHGSEACAGLAAASGCTGVELRRELFGGKLPDLTLLRSSFAEKSLLCVYSAPVELWTAAGELNKEELGGIIAEALSAGSMLVKTSLGHYRRKPGQLDRLKRYLEERIPAGNPLRLTVENDQTVHGGNLGSLLEFFGDCREAGLPIGLTFDAGNWLYTGVDSLEAAKVLAEHVVYIHLKHVDIVQGKPVTLPLPAEAGSLWRQVLRLLPADAPRTIEFPVAGEDLGDELRKYAEMIAGA
ncbi:hypothetical protein D3C75_728720 [compost metagenome]